MSKFKKVAAVVGLGVMVWFGTAVAGAVPASAQTPPPEKVCHTVGPTLPWYQCVNFTPGLPGPSGCYSHTVCK